MARPGVAPQLVVDRVRATNPTRVLSCLVPVVLVVSLTSDAAVALGVSVLGGVALGLMHLVVAATAIPSYHVFLPLPR